MPDPDILAPLETSGGIGTDRHFDEPESRLLAWRAISVIAALVTLRLFYLLIVPLDLAADEAYYWDWSRQLDWGYYSKPPMIAWIAAVSTWLGGHSEVAIRAPAVLCGGLALWAVFGGARSMYGDRVAWWALMTAIATPGNAAMSLFMTIDAPFLCAWCFAVWCVWELFSREQSAGRWLPLAILATGIGLLSKQTMLALIPLTGLWLALRKESRGFPWKKYFVWSTASLSFCLPALLWNLSNRWLTVQHTREHFLWRSLPWPQHLTYYAEFVASQAGILSPLTYLLILIFSIVALMTWHRQSDRERFVLCLNLIPLLGITGLSFMQRVQPNWPVAFHLTGMIFLAAWACGTWDSTWIPAHSRRWFGASLACGAAFVLMFYLFPFVISHTELIGRRFDPISRLRGWKQLAAEVNMLRSKLPADTKPLLITNSGRGIVSELAFYLPDHPRVYHWNPAGTIVSQHDVWGGPQLAGEQDALLMTTAGQPVPDGFLAACQTVSFVQTLRQERGGPRHDDYDVWLIQGLREWPHPVRYESTTPVVDQALAVPRSTSTRQQ